MTSALTFNNLQKEMKLEIFSWLSAKELFNCARVCKEWQVLHKDSSLWKRLFCTDFFYAYDTIGKKYSYRINFSDSNPCLLTGFIKTGIANMLKIKHHSSLNFQNDFINFLSQSEERNKVNNLISHLYKPLPQKFSKIGDFYSAYKDKFFKVYKFFLESGHDIIDLNAGQLRSLSVICSFQLPFDEKALADWIKEGKTRKFFQMYVIWEKIQSNTIKVVDASKKIQEIEISANSLPSVKVSNEIGDIIPFIPIAADVPLKKSFYEKLKGVFNDVLNFLIKHTFLKYFFPEKD